MMKVLLGLLCGDVVSETGRQGAELIDDFSMIEAERHVSLRVVWFQIQRLFKV